MSSLYRVLLAALMVGISFFAFNAYADNSNQGAQSSNQAAPAAHQRAAHHRAAANPVNINAADAATLGKIRGIGAKKAEAIVEYRSKNGNFQAVGDLKNITNAKGKPMFSEKAIERLEKRLTV